MTILRYSLINFITYVPVYLFVAKKRKQKKTGILKRQQKKRQKKMIQRRKTMPKRSPQQNGTPQQLEQLLSTLPTLAFEPELADLNMGHEELRTLLQSERTEADILMELLTEEFIADLDQRLEEMETVHSEKSIKSILAKVTRHQIANKDKIPYLSNPVLIAIFLKTRSAVEGKELDLAGLPAVMDEFDKRNHDYIQGLTQKVQVSEEAGLSIKADEELSEEEKIKEWIPAIKADIYTKYLALVPAEKQEQVEEDLDVFLVDFEPPPVAEWDADLVKEFMEKWFLENANPLEEDLESMRESLSNLFDFLAEEELLSAGFLDAASMYLQKS